MDQINRIHPKFDIAMKLEYPCENVYRTSTHTKYLNDEELNNLLNPNEYINKIIDKPSG